MKKAKRKDRLVKPSNITPEKKPTIILDKNTATTTKDAISNASNNLQNMLYDILPDLKTGEKQSTTIPWLYNMLGDFITNPSTVSIDTFRRMATTDPAMGSSLNYNSAIIAATIGPFCHENLKIEELVRFNLDNLDMGGFRGLVKNMMSAEWAGYFLGEMWETQKNGFYQIYSVNPIPPITTIFAVDNNGRVKDKNGIFQYVINTYAPGFQSFNVAGGGFSPVGAGEAPLEVDPFADGGDYAYPIRQPFVNIFGLNPLDTDMMIHFGFNDSFSLGSPYKQSKLRNVYSLYVMKYGVLQFLTQALYKKSMPMLVVKYDGTIQTQDPLTGQSQPLANSIRMATAEAGANGFAMYPTINGVDVDAIHIEGDLNIFKDILDWIDKSIYMGLGTPPTLNNVEGGSHSSSYLQDSLHNKLISDKKADITECLKKTLIKKIIDNNFIYGRDYTDYGYFKENTLSLDDKLKVVKIFESTENAGITSTCFEEDLSRMREMLGIDTTEKIDAQIAKLNMDSFKAEIKKAKTNQRSTKDITEVPFAHHNEPKDATKKL